MVCYVFGILVTEGALLELMYTPPALHQMVPI